MLYPSSGIYLTSHCVGSENWAMRWRLFMMLHDWIPSVAPRVCCLPELSTMMTPSSSVPGRLRLPFLAAVWWHALKQCDSWVFFVTKSPKKVTSNQVKNVFWATSSPITTVMISYRQLLHLLQISASVETFLVPFLLPFELLLQWDYADTCLNLDTHIVARHHEIIYLSITFSMKIISNLQAAKIKVE